MRTQSDAHACIACAGGAATVDAFPSRFGFPLEGRTEGAEDVDESDEDEDVDVDESLSSDSGSDSESELVSVSEVSESDVDD